MTEGEGILEFDFRMRSGRDFSQNLQLLFADCIDHPKYEIHVQSQYF